jgi:hypothetical protein
LLSKRNSSAQNDSHEETKYVLSFHKRIPPEEFCPYTRGTLTQFQNFSVRYALEALAKVDVNLNAISAHPLCVAAVFGMDETINREDAVDAEYPQRKNLMGL